MWGLGTSNQMELMTWRASTAWIQREWYNRTIFLNHRAFSQAQDTKYHQLYSANKPQIKTIYNIIINQSSQVKEGAAALLNRWAQEEATMVQSKGSIRTQHQEYSQFTEFHNKYSTSIAQKRQVTSIQQERQAWAHMSRKWKLQVQTTNSCSHMLTALWIRIKLK